MSRNALIVRTALALLAFAGNSLLCRLALKATTIDAATFTSVRLLSASLALWLILHFSKRVRPSLGNWHSAAALFVYAAGFSLAYINLTAGTGALLLFSAVQITMIGAGLARGERLTALQTVGVVLAVAGLIGLVLPGLTAPPPASAALMILAGIAWGVYSLRGAGASDPTNVTAGNFIRTLPMTLIFSMMFFMQFHFDALGLIYAIASGAITSGIGYAIWYGVLPHLRATQAATLQLSVPVIAAFGAVFLLGEAASLRLLLASICILSGIALVIQQRARKKLS
ncbi:DMT family transporter [Aestuariivirga litoralis]|uniref:DMT family transporter n=1 Tax=Aestuariivirga litoralis TaxID=2650924 RepID=UPI0018C7B787|nr:DMT family transporter [Aestuariivirga litoralis]MBG1231633.1 DMT family transporter [Aestuariivirga litoralis]